MFIFPTYKKISAPLEMSKVQQHRRLGVVQHVKILDFRTLNTKQGATILLYRDFTKENIISSLKKKSSPFFLQEFGPLILLKTKDMFTSLTIIGVKKIMCNNHIKSFCSNVYFIMMCLCIFSNVYI